MAFTATDSKPSRGYTGWKMSEPCRAGNCSECVAYLSDGAANYRCSCDCHGWDADEDEL